MKKTVKFLTGVVLLPTAFFILLGIVDVVWSLLKGYKVTMYFLLGFALYTLFHFFIFQFSRLYVIAHEAAHVIAAWCCGYKVSVVNIKEDSGNVKVSGVNVFILLAPYCIPFYAICITVIYFLLSLFVPSVRDYSPIFLASFGFFTALHCLHTYKALTETQQSDISQAGGGIFSFPVIVLGNAVIIVGLLELYFPGTVPIWDVTKYIVSNTIVFWRDAFGYAGDFLNWIFSKK